MKELKIKFHKPISGITYISVNDRRSAVSIRKTFNTDGYEIRWHGAVIDYVGYYRKAREIALMTIEKAY